LKNRIQALGTALVTFLAAASAATPPGSAQTVTRQPVNVAGEAGISEVVRTYSATVGDYDKDGDQDFLLVRHDPQAPKRGELIPQPSLYRNQGGTFTDVNTFSGKDRHDCAFGDANLDGRIDLFCAVGLTKTSVNELHIRQADGGWTNRASGYGITANTHGRYRTSEFLYANADMYPDVYVTRFYGANGDPLNPSPAEENPYPNEFWLNQGGTSFRAATEYGLTQPIGAQKDNNACNQAADFNKDGWDDLLVCAYNAMFLYQNQSGSGFVNVAPAKNIGGFWNDAQLADFNNDSRLDLAQVKSDRVRIKFGTSSNGFQQVFETSMAVGQNLAVGDFDNNGQRDVYVVGACPSTTNYQRHVDRPDYILFNQGSGVFIKKQIPAIPAEQGCGDDVQRIDYNNNGVADFLVLNGRKKEPGPVQLFTYR
jgi:FG-GAP-like repeat